MSNLIGQTLFNQYRIDAFIASGGMADVYRATDLHAGKIVAFKVIQPQNIRQSEQFLLRFRREAKVMARLEHSNIVRLLDYGDMNGHPFMVMEYLQGGTLRAQMNGRQIAWRNTAAVMLPIVQALEYAHSQNVIHRDIKPGNIIFTGSGQPKLADFGVAKIVAEEMTLELTGTNMPIGTAAYMSPEQARGKSEARSDVYSLGVVMHEMLSGRKLFEGDTPFDVMFKHASEPPAPLRRYVASIPQEAEQIVMRCLAKRPQERFENMTALAYALERGMNASAVVIDRIVMDEEPPRPPVRDGKDSGVKKKEPRRDNTDSRQNKHAARQREVLGWMIPIILLLVVLVGVGGSLFFSSPVIPKQVAVASSTKTPVQLPPTETQVMPTDTPIPPTNTPEPPTATPVPILGIGSTMISEKDGMTMVFVPSGEFTMGSDSGEPNEKPVHQVFLDAFWIDQTEVTNAMYEKCAVDGICKEPTDTSTYTHSSYYGNSEFDDYPVLSVDWNQAKTYCIWAGRRLPTEAEWEKAAHGMGGKTYPWGEDISCDKANYDAYCIFDITKIGSYPDGISSYGAYDMAGNVWEWVNDWYGETYYQSSPSSNPLGPDSGQYRVLRGGSWSSVDYHVRSAYRFRVDPTYTVISYFGFRCARSLP